MAVEPGSTEGTPTELTSPSRRGTTLRVARVIITFENGQTETWDFPPEARGYYREGRNRQTKPVRAWTTNELWWKSGMMVES